MNWLALGAWVMAFRVLLFTLSVYHDNGSCTADATPVVVSYLSIRSECSEDSLTWRPALTWGALDMRGGDAFRISTWGDTAARFWRVSARTLDSPYGCVSNVARTH